ncbi:MAG: NYN domain-containing protein [Planctomycetes bacterium]|nr:NYN domain-containing protein [Planctomycetota bacterium]
MHRNAALLIDLENFFIGREDNYNRSHTGEPYEFPVDLESLCAFASDMAGDARLVVRRAYANFNDRRPGEGERRWDYYLQPLPRFLMEEGIEPVQVFRFPGGSSKNAADMRLAMDATALLAGRSQIDRFILVTGDSDFIPLVLELKRNGAEVIVIGVAGCTKPIFGRYCDRFEYFEDLLAARELHIEDATELKPVREALRFMLDRRSPIKFAAVKPLLSDELRCPFDPSRFDCESTGEFLRKYAGELGVQVRRGEHDWEISVGGAAVLEAAAGGERLAVEAPTEAVYRDLLRQGIPRCYVVPFADFDAVATAVFRAARTEEGSPCLVVHHDLLEDATDACADAGVTDAGRKVRDATFQFFKSGCFVCADEEAEPGQTDFHWSRAAKLDPALADVRAMRERAWGYLIRLLERRLEQRGQNERIQLPALADLLAGPDPSQENLEIIRGLVEQAGQHALQRPAAGVAAERAAPRAPPADGGEQAG